jgi:hypothetical protein
MFAAFSAFSLPSAEIYGTSDCGFSERSVTIVGVLEQEASIIGFS